MRKAGLKFFDHLNWYQGYSDRSALKGSRSPACPLVSHRTEAILVFYKDSWIRNEQESDLMEEEWEQWTGSEVWAIPPEADRTHPAPYPLELPKRCIKLFSFPNDVVLDPFAGSGTTLAAAQQLGRKWIGIEKEARYCEMAKRRVQPQCPQEMTFSEFD